MQYSYNSREGSVAVCFCMYTITLLQCWLWLYRNDLTASRTGSKADGAWEPPEHTVSARLPGTIPLKKPQATTFLQNGRGGNALSCLLLGNILIKLRWTSSRVTKLYLDRRYPVLFYILCALETNQQGNLKGKHWTGREEVWVKTSQLLLGKIQSWPQEQWHDQILTRLSHKSVTRSFLQVPRGMSFASKLDT